MCLTSARSLSGLRPMASQASDVPSVWWIPTSHQGCPGRSVGYSLVSQASPPSGVLQPPPAPPSPWPFSPCLAQGQFRTLDPAPPAVSQPVKGIAAATSSFKIPTPPFFFQMKQRAQRQTATAPGHTAKQFREALVTWLSVASLALSFSTSPPTTRAQRLRPLATLSCYSGPCHGSFCPASL